MQKILNRYMNDNSHCNNHTGTGNHSHVPSTHFPSTTVTTAATSNHAKNTNCKKASMPKWYCTSTNIQKQQQQQHLLQHQQHQQQARPTLFVIITKTT
jgi:hypothetical protein